MLAINLTRLIFLFIGLNPSFSFHLLKNNYVKFPSSSKLQISPSLLIPYTKLTEVSTISLSSLIIKSRFTNFKLDSTQTSFLLSIIYSLLRKVSIDNSNILIQTYAWSYFLQSSLVLNILSTSSSSANRNKSATKSQTQNSLNYKHLLFTFILASLGSFIGAIISFYLTKTLFSPTVINNLEHIIVPIAASLAASYIGGTANYFEVANILSQNSDRPFNSNTINLVAGIDITIMVLFFNILMLIQKSNLNEWLSPKVLGNNMDNNKTEAFVIDSNADFKTNNSFQLKYFFRVIKLIILSLVVSVISCSLQKTISIQGASVILTIVFSLFIRNFIPNSEIILSEFTDLSSKVKTINLYLFYHIYIFIHFFLLFLIRLVNLCCVCSMLQLV